MFRYMTPATAAGLKALTRRSRYPARLSVSTSHSRNRLIGQRPAPPERLSELLNDRRLRELGKLRGGCGERSPTLRERWQDRGHYIPSFLT